jgi:hypothetical protein
MSSPRSHSARHRLLAFVFELPVSIFLPSSVLRRFAQANLNNAVLRGFSDVAGSSNPSLR